MSELLQLIDGLYYFVGMCVVVSCAGAVSGLLAGYVSTKLFERIKSRVEVHVIIKEVKHVGTYERLGTR